MTLRLQMSISIAGWMVSKCTSVAVTTGGAKVEHIIPPTFLTVEINCRYDIPFSPWLLFRRSWLSELSKSDWKRLDIACRRKSGIPVVAVVSWELMENQLTMRQTSFSSSTNFSFEACDSPRKTQPASEGKLIQKFWRIDQGIQEEKW